MSHIEEIDQCCRSLGIIRCTQEPPVEMSPGCFVFYGIELTIACRRYGQCKYERYCAVSGRNKITIIPYGIDK